MNENIQSAAVGASVGTSAVPHHIHNGADSPALNIFSIQGGFPTTAGITPTGNPGNFGTSLVLDSTTGRIWYYDITNSVWTSTATNFNVFGTGSDGAATLDGTNTYSFLSKVSNTYTMTRDVYFSNLTINTGVTLQTGGYIIFVSGTLTQSGTGIIDNSGGVGGVGGDGGNGGSGGTAGSAGTAGASATVPVVLAGKTGGAGGVGSTNTADGTAGSVGTTGANVSNSLGQSGANGANGGAGGSASTNTPGAAGTKGTGGSVTPALGDIYDVLATRYLSDMVSGVLTPFNLGASGGAGGGGGGGCGHYGGGAGSIKAGNGGGGGGSGGNGGWILAYVNKLVTNSQTLFQTNGGNGGIGGSGGNATQLGGAVTANAGGGGGGGGGAGGDGGAVVVVYHSLTGSLLYSVNGGAGGSGGPGGNLFVSDGTSPTNGVTGSTGTSGNLGITRLLPV